MSTLETCRIVAKDVEQMRKSGESLVGCLYKHSETISLFGDLGAGKTTFVQGMAKGLGIKGNVVSPSFTLEQRYQEKLAHIDLYRLHPVQAAEFSLHMEDFLGIRAIEWPERMSGLDPDIAVKIVEGADGERILDIDFQDISIPSDGEIDAWIREVKIPKHIVNHMNCVAGIAGKCAKHLLANGIIVRTKALLAAAKVHDLLRFVDFRSWEGSEMYTPTKEDTVVWQSLKDRYGTPHEAAANRMMQECGYPEIGSIVSVHRGMEKDGDTPLHLKTTEQKILAYADKRARFDAVVSLDERFDDFISRYGKGIEGDHARVWRKRMKELEIELFPGGTPF